MSGRTPWPMLPKPTKTRRPGNATWTGYWLMMARDRGGEGTLAGRVVYPESPAGHAGADRRNGARSAARRAFAPVRRIGAVVARQTFDAADPASDRRVGRLHRQEARPQVA